MLATKILQQRRNMRAEGQRRRALVEDRAALSSAIHAHLLQFSALEKATNIHCYVGIKDEVSTLPLITALLNQGKALFVPFFDLSTPEETPQFRIENITDLEQTANWFWQPNLSTRANPQRQAPPGNVELFLVPGICFDKLGNRLGSGLGYYDRLLAKRSSNALIIGLCFEAQIIDAIPTLPHDQAMRYLITENGVRTIMP